MVSDQLSARMVLSRSPAETRAEGARFAHRVGPGQVIALVGPLGIGKTEFVRGFVAALDSNASVRSPSFTLVNVYDTPRFPIYHLDFYRIRSPSELSEIGLAEYLDNEGVCIIEWADMFLEELPRQTTTVVRFSDAGDGVRRISYESWSQE